MRGKSIGLAFCGLTLAASAHAAEPTAADRATARVMLDEGYGLLAKGKPTEALQRFVGADALMNHLPTTKLAMARAQIALKQLVEAEDSLTFALRTRPAPDEPAALAKAREDAGRLLTETSPRIPEVTIVVSTAPGAAPEVRVDGSVVPTESLVAPRRLNPGSHSVEATLAGRKTASSVDLAEAEHKTVTLDLEATATAPAPAPVNVGPRPEGPRDHSGNGGTSRWLIGGLAVAGTGLAIGGVSGILALSAQSDANSAGCVDDRCPPAAHDDVDAAKRWATVSTIGFVLAGVGLVTTVVMLMLPGR